MALSVKTFYREMYQEHLEEISFLFEQRLSYSQDLELSWHDLEDIDDRIESHLDALVIGESLALEVCAEQALKEDFGEVYGTVRIFCRIGRKDLMAKVFDSLEFDDSEMVFAVVSAMRSEMPTSWRQHFFGKLDKNEAGARAVLPRVFGYRRFEVEQLLLDRIEADADSAELSGFIWALGRCGSNNSIETLLKLLSSSDETIKDSVSIALLRLKEQRPIKTGLLAAQVSSWPRKALGVGGSRQAVNVFRDIVAGEKADSQSVLSLGLLGDLAAVGPLVKLLNSEELACDAAIALNLILGASLMEEVFVEDSFSEEELSEEELAAFTKDGAIPVKGDGEPYGEWMIRPCQNPSIWRDWLEANKANFDKNYRWRLGKKYGPTSLVNSLIDSSTPGKVRAMIADELVIRYNLEIPFESDLPVAIQTKLLGKISTWAQQAESTFTPGEWYFSGVIQS